MITWVIVRSRSSAFGVAGFDLGEQSALGEQGPGGTPRAPVPPGGRVRTVLASPAPNASSRQ